MEATTSNEDVLVVLQTENGEQIALPMSALPNDFVPGDSGQIIMVESGLDEQQQEIVVESTDLAGHHQTSSSDLVSLQHVDPNSQIPTLELMSEGNETALETSDIEVTMTPTASSNHTLEILTSSVPTTSFGDKSSAPRTYSKSNVVKSYAPTCGLARIYQQCQPVPGQQQHQQQQQQPQHQQQQEHQHQDNQIQPEHFQNSTNNVVTSDNSADKQQEPDKDDPSVEKAEATEIEEKPVIIPHCKQKRKEPHSLRPIEEDDMRLECIEMREPSPPVHEPDVKRRRKEHRSTKKSKIKPHTQQIQQAPLQQQPQQKEPPAPEEPTHRKLTKQPSHQQIAKKEEQQQADHEPPTLPKQQSRQYLHHQQQQQQPQTERRTRLSNTCRVATGKNYRCNDCDFSTDRINNIVLHVKEQCPYLKRKDID